jgi:hypothetical protein
VVAEVPYTLRDLRSHVNITAILPTPAATVPEADDHPDGAVAISSNAVFRSLASWARQRIHHARAMPGMNEADWQALVEQQALSLARTQPGDVAASSRRRGAVLRLAQQVARWTWENGPAARQTPKLTPAEVTARQAHAGRHTAKARGERSRAAIVAAALRLAAESRSVTQVAVLAIVKITAGLKSERTVARHWQAVQAALAESTSSINPTDAPPS